MEDESFLINVFTTTLNEKPYVARMSRYLFDTLIHSDRGTFRGVVEAIDHMEQLPVAKTPRVKPASSFRGPILSGLSKTHYMTTQFLPKNVLLHWVSKDNRGTAKQAGELFDSTVAAEPSHDLAWDVAGQIAGSIVEGFDVRAAANKLTGEWVIYREWEGKNYYLSLGVHAELKDEQALFDRVRSGCPEFPFCFL